MDIHRIYGVIAPHFRKRRFAMFQEAIAPTTSDLILDVGGFPDTWIQQPPVGKRIDVTNLTRTEFDPASAPAHSITTNAGDGTALEHADQSYDIVFSNSVVEHVGDFDAQRRFAGEVRRIGGKVWVQTPAKEFFFEPHFLAPFIHWLPIERRHRLARFTPWALITKPSTEQIAATVDEIRLLTFEEMTELFPDCEIRREKVLGFFTKSFIAIRV